MGKHNAPGVVVCAPLSCLLWSAVRAAAFFYRAFIIYYVNRVVKHFCNISKNIFQVICNTFARRSSVALEHTPTQHARRDRGRRSGDALRLLRASPAGIPAPSASRAGGRGKYCRRAAGVSLVCTAQGKKGSCFIKNLLKHCKNPLTFEILRAILFP